MRFSTPIPGPHHIVFYCANCGSGGSDWLSVATFIAAIVAVVIALIALGWSRSEHVAFLNRLKSRARLRLTLVPRDAPGAVDVDDDPMAIGAPVGLSWDQVFQLSVINDGDGAAGPTIVNVVIRGPMRRVFWSTSQRQPLADMPAALETEEVFEAGGASVPARWISRELPRVSTKSPVILFFAVGITGDDVEVPIRVKADCDELGPDVPEASEMFLLKIHDSAPPYGLRGRPPLQPR